MIRFDTIVLCAALMLAPVAASAQGRQQGLRAFTSDAELRMFLRAVQKERDRIPPPPPPAPPPPPPPPAMMAAPPPGAAARAPVPGAPNITNTQIAGVDEGGIVKMRGDIMVVLRRGRLFTVNTAKGAMRRIDQIDAYPPGVDARYDWYDEMLVSGDRVVVIGFSYARGGTQVNRFKLSADGRLAFEDAYHIRSNDYYSSRNYASRMIGSKLILYSPLNVSGDQLDSILPAMRKWTPAMKFTGGYGAPQPGGWRRIAAARSIYVPASLRDPRQADLDTLHTVTTCDLAAAELACTARGVLGAASRTFFVSQNAVYVWIGNMWLDEQWSRGGKRVTRKARPDSILYRLPLADGAVPQAVMARGMPVDQFSFMPDSTRSTLHVVVRAYGGGDAMWGPEVTAGALALVSIPTGLFTDGSREVPLARYRTLPRQGASWSFQNRFVGDSLVYGLDPAQGKPAGVAVVPLGGGPITTVALDHGVQRIDAIGPDAIAIGQGAKGLGFSAITLGGTPRRASTWIAPDAREGESRSQAFFFRPDTDSADGGSGILGLPVARSVRTSSGIWATSSGMQFLRRRDGKLEPAGELLAKGFAMSPQMDACVASCSDWYGNARPIFLGDRLFALLGYELVEGSDDRTPVREIDRIDFMPTRAN